MLVSVGERGRVGIVVLKIWFKKSLWPPSTLRASGFSFSKFLCLRQNFIYYSTNIQHFTTYWMHKQVLAFNYLLWTWLQRSFSSVQLLSRVQLFATPWIAARQASLSITNSRSLPKPMSIESVMPSSHLILCRPFSSCPQSLPASESFPMRQLFTWGGQSIGVSASTSGLPMNIQDWSPLGWTGWISLQSRYMVILKHFFHLNMSFNLTYNELIIVILK